MTENTKKTIEIDPKALGQRIRALRLQRGYTLVHMARLTGYCRTVLTVVERFEQPVNPEHIRRIAKALEVSLAYLVVGKDVSWSSSLEAAFELCTQLSTRPCSCGGWKIQYRSLCTRCETRKIAERANHCRCGTLINSTSTVCPDCRMKLRNTKLMVPCACGGLKSPTAKRCLACRLKAKPKINPAEALRVYERLQDYRAAGKELGCSHETVRQALSRTHIIARRGRA
jgi:Helix-turn-helix domain